MRAGERRPLQPVLTGTFLASPQWDRLAPPARGLLQGLLGLAIGRDGEWFVDATPKELADWFGPELQVKPAAIYGVLRELDEAGWLRKGRRGFGNRFVLAPSIVAR